MRRGRLVFSLVVGGILLGLALGYDALTAGSSAVSRINEAAAVRSVVQDSLGLVEGNSCFRPGTEFRGEDRASYYTCAASDLTGGLASDQRGQQCGQMLMRGTSGLRDLPFTDNRFYFLIFVAGHPANEVRAALQSARGLPLQEYIQRYPLNELPSEAYFHTAPEPLISGLDCDGYSLTRLEYAAVGRPRTSSP